jgi:nitrogen-specific signal transduction histidine kinase
MNQTIGKTLDKLFHRVKYHSGKSRSPLSYNVMNPLANIRLAIEMVEAKNTDTDIMLYVDIIKRNCETINYLINEVLPTEMPFIVQDKNPRVRTVVSQEY